MMNADEVLVTNLDSEIQRRREDVESSPDRDIRSRWTNRYLERVTAEAGTRIAHSMVRRMRIGDRPLTTAEWLLFSQVLSIPPMDLLLRPDQHLKIGGRAHSGAAVRAWIRGEQPLASLPEPGLFEWSRVAREPDESDFQRSLRALVQSLEHGDLDEQVDTIALLLGLLSGRLTALRTSRTRDTDSSASAMNETRD